MIEDRFFDIIVLLLWRQNRWMTIRKNQTQFQCWVRSSQKIVENSGTNHFLTGTVPAYPSTPPCTMSDHVALSRFASIWPMDAQCYCSVLVRSWTSPLTTDMLKTYLKMHSTLSQKPYKNSGNRTLTSPHGTPPSLTYSTRAKVTPKTWTTTEAYA